MRSKVLEQIAYKGDCSEACEFHGASTAIIIVKGGSGAKLTTCDTINGEFEDYATLENGLNIVDVSGALKYIKVENAEYSDLMLGDCKIDPQFVTSSIVNPPYAFYAYTFKDGDDDFVIYTKEQITEAGTYEIFTPEVGTTYGYELAKGDLVVEDVDDDGKLTDDSNVVYTPDEDSNILL